MKTKIEFKTPVNPLVVINTDWETFKALRSLIGVIPFTERRKLVENNSLTKQQDLLLTEFYKDTQGWNYTKVQNEK
jgi:hypothetical protein